MAPAHARGEDHPALLTDTIGEALERTVQRWPDQDAQVIGVPDDKYGEELMAWIVLRDGAEILAAEHIREFAAEKLARQKIPRYVHTIDSFPMTVTGKVRKVELREMAIERLAENS